MQNETTWQRQIKIFSLTLSLLLWDMWIWGHCLAPDKISTQFSEFSECTQSSLKVHLLTTTTKSQQNSNPTHALVKTFSYWLHYKMPGFVQWVIDFEQGQEQDAKTMKINRKTAEHFPPSYLGAVNKCRQQAELRLLGNLSRWHSQIHCKCILSWILKLKSSFLEKPSREELKKRFLYYIHFRFAIYSQNINVLLFFESYFVLYNMIIKQKYVKSRSSQ